MPDIMAKLILNFEKFDMSFLGHSLTEALLPHVMLNPPYT